MVCTRTISIHLWDNDVGILLQVSTGVNYEGNKGILTSVTARDGMHENWGVYEWLLGHIYESKPVPLLGTKWWSTLTTNWLWSIIKTRQHHGLRWYGAYVRVTLSIRASDLWSIPSSLLTLPLISPAVWDQWQNASPLQRAKPLWACQPPCPRC